MRAALIVFPGSNRERDMQMALERITGRPPVMVWHRESELPETDLVVLPGGFAHGDYLRPGAMAAHSPVMAEVARRAHQGVPILGVCNGFQVLTEAGLLPGAMLRNRGLKFICKDVHLRVESNQTIFTNGYRAHDVFQVPVAHHDGSYFADAETLGQIVDADQVAFRYCRASGEICEDANPNGSVDNIAGLFNRGRTVLGMMPHPENVTDEALGTTGGRALFDGLVAALGR